MVSHYEVVEKLGEGGMGVVYKARDRQLGRMVALKILPATALDNPEKRRRFVQEAQAASALNHPNIVTIYEITRDKDIDFIVMELVKGKTLDHLIGRRGVPLEAMLKISVQIADALACAHAGGIVHRDLKPGNVMVTESGLVKLLDFGLAKLLEPPAFEGMESLSTQTVLLKNQPFTEEGVIVGTAAYMSPEQAEGKSLDARSDIFSFGAVMYEMLTGRRPFHGETKLSTLSAILSRDPKSIRETHENTPPEVERIIFRCLRKDPNRRFQHMDDVKVALLELKEESASGQLPAASTPARSLKNLRRGARLVLLSAALLAVAVTSGILWKGRRAPAPAKPTALFQLTWDTGLTTDPAISPDGKLLAYASDRQRGDLDIYVQQTAGGQAVRLTREESGESQPNFSPDGLTIVFRSERDGGGLYTIPVLGGQQRFLARGGRNPHFSPDGSWIAYWAGEPRYSTGGRIYIVQASGGVPRQLQPDFLDARTPVWSRDGSTLVFEGTRDLKAPANERVEWWAVPFRGGGAVKTNATRVFNGVGLEGSSLGAWTRQGLVFSGVLESGRNLWLLPVSPDGIAAGMPERLTFGTAREMLPSVSATGRIAFANLSDRVSVWSLPVSANQARVTGDLRVISRDTAPQAAPSLSADGKKMVFTSRRSGRWEVYCQDLVSGEESALTNTPAEERDLPKQARISRDGAYVVYGGPDAQRRWPLYVVSSRGGGPEKVCQNCGFPMSWSPDGSKILYQGSRFRGLGLLDLKAGDRGEIVRHPDYHLFAGSFSPDDRWIAFAARIGEGRRQLFIVPFQSDVAADDRQWIPVTEGSTFDGFPQWSPDGRLLYFMSERDGFRCLWAQALDRFSGRVSGAPVPIRHFHSPRLSLRDVTMSWLGMSLAGDKAIFNMAETTGNIWMVALPE